jgi:hypothetical protein
MARNYQRTCLAIASISATLLFGCGGKGSTKFTYVNPDVLPLSVRFSVDHKGIWSVQAAVANPLSPVSWFLPAVRRLAIGAACPGLV